MMAGRARKMGLGDFELVSLKDARKKRDAAYGLVVDGVDPIDDREARKAAQTAEKAKALTFKECAEGYIAAHKSGWKSDKHIGLEGRSPLAGVLTRLSVIFRCRWSKPHTS